MTTLLAMLMHIACDQCGTCPDGSLAHALVVVYNDETGERETWCQLCWYGPRYVQQAEAAR